MNERPLIVDVLKLCVGKYVSIFCMNGFQAHGQVIAVDDSAIPTVWLEFTPGKVQSYGLSSISSLGVDKQYLDDALRGRGGHT